MNSPCSCCKKLIDSALVTEPHQHLYVVRQSAGSKIYRCSLCDTMFEFTAHDIYLLDVSHVTNIENDHSHFF